jgi:hypothetical protein
MTLALFGIALRRRKSELSKLLLKECSVFPGLLQSQGRKWLSRQRPSAYGTILRTEAVRANLRARGSSLVASASDP